MTAADVHRLMATLEHVLADLPLDVREPLDIAHARLVGYCLDALAEVKRLRRDQQGDAYRRVFRLMTEPSAS